jgi:hypothetical protein
VLLLVPLRLQWVPALVLMPLPPLLLQLEHRLRIRIRMLVSVVYSGHGMLGVRAT